MEEWKEYKLSDIVEINPTESLKKGTVAKKIGSLKFEFSKLTVI